MVVLPDSTAQGRLLLHVSFPVTNRAGVLDHGHGHWELSSLVPGVS